MTEWRDRRKVSKESLHYRPGSDAKHCGNCTMFDHGKCSLVSGHIDAEMRCDKWEAHK